MDLFIDILGWTFLVIIILGLIAFYFREPIFDHIMLNKGGQGGIVDENYRDDGPVIFKRIYPDSPDYEEPKPLFNIDKLKEELKTETNENKIYMYEKLITYQEKKEKKEK